MITTTTLLLQNLPGLDSTMLPGIPIEYIPTQAAEQVWAVYERMLSASRLLFPLLLIVAGLLRYARSLLPDDPPGEIITLAMTAITLAILLTFNPLIFGWTIQIGRAVSQQVHSDEEARELNRQFRIASEEELAGREAGGGTTWFQTLSAFVAIITPGLTTITELMLAIGTVLFYATVIITGMLWKILVAMLFMMSPLLITTGLIPRFGPRILGAYYGALIQVSAIQVWMACCAFMVRTTDYLFQPQMELISEGRVSITNHHEAIAITFIFTFLYWMGWFVVAWMFPISRSTQAFGHLAQMGVATGINFAAGTLKTIGTAGTGGAAGAGASASRVAPKKTP